MYVVRKFEARSSHDRRSSTRWNYPSHDNKASSNDGKPLTLREVLQRLSDEEGKAAEISKEVGEKKLPLASFFPPSLSQSCLCILSQCSPTSHNRARESYTLRHSANVVVVVVVVVLQINPHRRRKAPHRRSQKEIPVFSEKM
jgi:hypothetical protein